MKEKFMQARCAACGGLVEFPRQFVGGIGKCPHCEAEITMLRVGILDRLKSFKPGWRSTSTVSIIAIGGIAAFMYFDHPQEVRRCQARQEELLQEANDIAKQAAAQRETEAASLALEREQAAKEAEFKEFMKSVDDKFALDIKKIDEDYQRKVEEANRTIAEIDRRQASLDEAARLRRMDAANAELRKMRELNEREELRRQFHVRRP